MAGNVAQNVAVRWPRPHRSSAATLAFPRAGSARRSVTHDLEPPLSARDRGFFVLGLGLHRSGFAALLGQAGLRGNNVENFSQLLNTLLLKELAVFVQIRRTAWVGRFPA